MEPSSPQVVMASPIGKEVLAGHRASFNTICKKAGISFTLDTLFEPLRRRDLQDLTSSLISVLRLLCDDLPSKTGRGALRDDLIHLDLVAQSDSFDFYRVKPLLDAALDDNPVDDYIWEHVYRAVTLAPSTPPLGHLTSSVESTPLQFNTSTFSNTTEYHKHMDEVLKGELHDIYFDVDGIEKAFFGGMAELETTSKAIFQKCKEGDNPLFGPDGKWRGWPASAAQNDVLRFLQDLTPQLAELAKGYRSDPIPRRKLLAQPTKHILGPIAKRSIDVAFVNDCGVGGESQWSWSQILVTGELKSNSAEDRHAKTWYDLGKYAREVFAAQADRRFVLGFTLCGSIMRIWEFDRLGGIASTDFDIHEEGLRFIHAIIGFLWMNEEELGFDPTLTLCDGKQVVEINRNGAQEHFVIDEVIRRARCIAGRATVCYKGHQEDQPGKLVVIKSSWQYPEREEEGELLRQATDKGVVNVAKYYWHYTVKVRGEVDDVRDNVRKGLDIRTGKIRKHDRLQVTPGTFAVGASREGSSSSIAGSKRPSLDIDAPLPPSKRSCSASPSKANGDTLSNRVHRVVIMSSYGKPIYTASTRAVLLEALEGCIRGHESLYKAGILHRDISINNLMINEDDDNPSSRSFLIDLDLAIAVGRDGASGARGMTGTRAFMAVNVLRGGLHSYIHDLESFFWVLFWICIHYNGPDKSTTGTEYEAWNFKDPKTLSNEKLGLVAKEDWFLAQMGKHVRPYYKPLIPLLNQLRNVVFPQRQTSKVEDDKLYDEMIRILAIGRQEEVEAEYVSSRSVG